MYCEYFLLLYGLPFLSLKGVSDEKKFLNLMSFKSLIISLMVALFVSQEIFDLLHANENISYISSRRLFHI